MAIAKRFLVICLFILFLLGLVVMLGWGGEFMGGGTPIVSALEVPALILFLSSPFVFVPLCIGVFTWLMLKVFEEERAEENDD